MKKQKGVTLISLTIYIIAVVIVISMITVISRYFYKNITYSSRNVDPMVEYTKFNSFFTEETNLAEIEVFDSKTTTDENKVSYVVFNNGIQYTYISQNKGIYRNKVKIARNIDDCEFKIGQSDGKTTITVNFLAGDFKNSITYTLK